MKHRTVVLVATALFSLWGLVVYLTVPRDYDPSFEFRTAAVVTKWPGVSVQRVEELVTYPVEEMVASIEEVEKVESTTKVGLSIVEVTLEDAVTDVSATWDKIRAEVEKISVPTDQGCTQPQFDSTLGDISILMLAVFQLPQEQGSRYIYSDRELEEIAERLRDEIRLLPQVAEARIFGSRKEAIFLESDTRTWSQSGITIEHLKTQLQSLNIVRSAGSIDSTRDHVNVYSSGNLNAVDEINDLVVHTESNGTPIHLQDIGVTVVRGYQEPPHAITRFSRIETGTTGQRIIGAPAVSIAIEMKEGHNLVQLGDEIRELIDKAKLSILPADVDIGLIVDRPTLVKKTIDNFVASLCQAVLIVLGVAFLLLGLRMATVIAMAIPVVLLTTLALMRFWDIELQQISIGSLIVALGLLVDNAIEVCDNIHRLLHEGRSRYEAAVEGARQIAMPMIIATGTTIASFLPMAIGLEGTIGEYSFSLPMVVSLCLAVSWLVAMTFTTVMAFLVLRRSTIPTPIGRLLGILKRVSPHSMRNLTFNDVFVFASRTAIRFKFLTVMLGFFCFLGAGWIVAAGKVDNSFFPQAARDQFVIEIYAPQGSPIGLTDEKTRQVEEIVLELSEFRDSHGDTKTRLSELLTFVGDGGPRFESVFIPDRPDPAYALIIVRVPDYRVVNDYVEDIRVAASSKITGVRVVPHTYGFGEPIPNPISIRIHGAGFADMDVMRAVARDVEHVTRDSRRAWNVHNSWGPPSFHFAIDVDTDKANRSGIKNSDVARTLNAYFSGEQLTTFREGKHQIPVYFRSPSDQRDDVREIERVFVDGANAKVPLDEISLIHSGWETTRIDRYNMNRMIEVGARPYHGDLAIPVLLESIKPKLDEMENELPPGLHFEYGGEIEKTQETMPMIAKSGLISVVTIFFLLVLHFNSIVKPWLILSMLPMAASGAIVGLYLLEEPMGFMAQLGFLSLFGVVINDAIVLITFVEMLIREKLATTEVSREGRRSYSGLTRPDFRECLIQGARIRVTPIMLTTLTTVGGLIPLLFAGPMFRALAAAMIFGLMVATFMTLFVLPALVAILVETFRFPLIANDDQA